MEANLLGAIHALAGNLADMVIGCFCVNFLCRLHAFGRHIFARSWWLEVPKHVEGLGLLGQELFVDQRMYECEKEVESLV